MQWKSDVATLVAAAAVAMRSPCAGDALDPPLWIVPNKSLSLSYFPPYSHFLIVNKTLSLSLSPSQAKNFPEACSEPHHSSGSDLSAFCSKWLRVLEQAVEINLPIPHDSEVGLRRGAAVSTANHCAVESSAEQWRAVALLCCAEQCRAVRSSPEQYRA